MRAIVAIVLLQSIAGIASAADTLATPAVAPAPIVALDSTAKVAPKPPETTVVAPKATAVEVKEVVKPAPLCPKMAMPMNHPECPWMAMEKSPCCGGMEPGWGIGARVLGSTSELLFHFPVSPRTEIAVRAGWNSATTSENDPWVQSTYRLEDVLNTGDTSISYQNLTGAGHLEATTNTARLALQILGDFPKGRGVDLLVGAGPQVRWEWSDSTNATDGMSNDTVPLHLRSTSTSWTVGAGLLTSLGARWWFVPGKLALVAELQAGVEWSYTSRIADQASVQRTNTDHSVGYPYIDHKLQQTGTTTAVRSNWWSISTSTATCSIGIDAFF